MPLPGPSKVTLSQIEEVLSSCLGDPALYSGTRLSQVRFENFEVERRESVIVHYTSKQRLAKLEDLCKQLFIGAQDPISHVEGIESLLAPLMNCHFIFEDSFKNVSQRAHHLLQRLPLQPLALLDFPDSLDRGYFQIDLCVEQHEAPKGTPTWRDLLLCNTLSINVVRIALLVASDHQMVHITPVLDHINLLAEVLEISCNLSSSGNQVDSDTWFVVRAAIWSSWQRCQMLYFWGLARNDLAPSNRVSWSRSGMLLLSPTPSPGLSLQKMSRRCASHGKEDYMCSWAFELLRVQQPCIGMDFRRLHAFFRAVWEGQPGRCNGTSGNSCDATQSSACQRFVGLEIVDQSAHDVQCSSLCHKLLWDRASFVSTKGSRAVSLEKTDMNGPLRYCAASNRTLAISHVWSHGQGGRPHDGINRCLHMRYYEVARQLDCDSYWWDAPCIPEEHGLRTEAIRNINQTFAASRVTLVCDRDLMAIDVSNLGMQTKQAIFATFLVSDWNTRAWTYLESMRGQHQIHILCKNNKTVSFQELVEDIVRNGAIDLAIMCLTTAHALPQSTHKGATDKNGKPYVTGLTVETAGSFLSHRPASRLGDDVVIWSLLIGNEPLTTARELWRSQRWVNTEFLLSGAPRLTLPGLSWAPASPYWRSDRPLDMEGSGLLPYRSAECSGSGLAVITDEGLVAEWMIYKFHVPKIGSKPSGNVLFEGCAGPECASALLRISRLYLSRYSRGALVKPAYDGERLDMTNKYRGTMIAVLGAREKGAHLRGRRSRKKWKWRGVFEWERNTPLPSFSYVRDLLIA